MLTQKRLCAVLVRFEKAFPLRVGALRKHADGMFLATDRSGYAARRELMVPLSGYQLVLR